MCTVRRAKSKQEKQFDTNQIPHEMINESVLD